MENEVKNEEQDQRDVATSKNLKGAVVSPIENDIVEFHRDGEVREAQITKVHSGLLVNLDVAADGSGSFQEKSVYHKSEKPEGVTAYWAWKE